MQVIHKRKPKPELMTQTELLAYVHELEAKNKRLEESFQKATGAVAATDCVKCKDKAYINNDENAEKWRHFELTT
jgi:hypothetical protein